MEFLARHSGELHVYTSEDGPAWVKRSAVDRMLVEKVCITKQHRKSLFWFVNFHSREIGRASCRERV